MKRLLLAATVIAVAVTAQAAQNPEAVFNRIYGVCHDGQLPMAPKGGDYTTWESRLAKGMLTLVQHVTNGFNAIPSRDLCTDCSAEDYQATIQWMMEE